MVRTKSFKIAAVQAAPVFLNLGASVDKACELIREAGGKGAELVVFPEAFLPGYPIWVWFIPPGHTHPLRALYSTLLSNSIEIPGAETQRLGEVAKEQGVTLAIGVNERNSEASNSSLYNTLLYIGPEGSILGRHRKLIPTAGERLVWAQGDGSDLEVYSLPFGKLGGLICWENYMPLARYALSAWGEQIHVAPTWDRGEPWLSTMRHTAKESRTFVISACQAFHKDDIPGDLAFKDDITMSRIHATIVKEGSDYRIFDEQSTSGSFVNEQRVPDYGIQLIDRDEIRLGGVTLRFRQP